MNRQSELLMETNAEAAITGVILAGGKSTRFGSDKAAALLLGRPMLQWSVSALGAVCDELVVVVAKDQVLPAFDAPVPVKVSVDA
ncbi:MAG TPA: NTP transferase domain-containing protein, partial [Tepidiformaceae bacterium]|nr:NTP transferase domain-containing protein [Tepidiformaceae bacterium]